MNIIKKTFLLAVLTSTLVSGQDCPADEINTDCGTACPLTCGNYNSPPLICAAVCVQGCFCPPGKVRDTSTDECVTPDQCDVSSETTTTPNCPANEEYTTCGPACPSTCDNHDSPIACSLQCVVGCFCPPDKVRDTSTGACVTPEQCDVSSETATTAEPTTTTLAVCTANEEYKACGTACQPTCSNPSPSACIANCVSGCFCTDGYVRDETTGNCLSVDTCPDNQVKKGGPKRSLPPFSNGGNGGNKKKYPIGRKPNQTDPNE